MNPVANIRRARADEAHSIAVLIDEAYSPWIARIGQKPGPMLEDYTRVIVHDIVFVRTDDSGIIAVLVLSQDAHELLLGNVAVASRCKGQGIGKQLIASAEDYARGQGCEAIRLYTHESMSENLVIYRKLGYQETHRATEHGFPRVFMRKVL